MEVEKKSNPKLKDKMESFDWSDFELKELNVMKEKNTAPLDG